MREIACIVVLGIISFTLYSCGESEGVGQGYIDDTLDRGYTRIQNQIFIGTIPIELEITPDVAKPSFAWRATGSKYVVLAIFRDKIDLKDGRIANIEDAVWMWHTGMGRGREGNVSYDDGADVRNGVIQDSVTPLAPGTYYIAVWGYSDEYELIYSSKEYLYQYYP
jgi:hypothetical protein